MAGGSAELLDPPVLSSVQEVTLVLPNFLVIGAAKAGTTSLYHYLRSHPQVFMSEHKELNFFVENDGWVKGTSWYERQFEAAGDALAVGEASPNYTKYPVFPGVPERIAKLIPDARLIYLVRHPIQRFRSGYLDEIRRGRQRGPIERTLVSNPGYLDASRYAMQIEQYLKHFPRDQLLVITSEDLKHHRAATMRVVHSFLGVEDVTPAALADEFNRSEGQRVLRPLARRVRRLPGAKAVGRLAPGAFRGMGTTPLDLARAELSDAFEDQLRALLRDDVRQLRSYLGADFDGWGIA
jgi:Sulfotransferase family